MRKNLKRKKINEKENKDKRIVNKKGKKFLKEYERDSGEEKFEEKKFDEKERKNLGGERAKKIIKNKIEKSQNYVLNQNMFNKKRGNQRAEILGLLNIKKDEKKGVEGNLINILHFLYLHNVIIVKIIFFYNNILLFNINPK